MSWSLPLKEWGSWPHNEQVSLPHEKHGLLPHTKQGSLLKEERTGAQSNKERGSL